jgi:hypothetical protein
VGHDLLWRPGVTAVALSDQGVAVEADGGFDGQWRSSGITYSVTLDPRASATDLARLGAVVDEVAETPRAVRYGAPVERRA